MPEPKHLGALDGIRGIAILMVLAVHAVVFHFLPDTTPWQHWVNSLMWTGWSGVDLFFVLSGFLITGILLQTKAASNRVSSFYGRRVLRIFPLYYFAVFAAMIGGYFWLNHAWMRANYPSPAGWASYVFYYQNWWMPLKEPDHGLVGHFWSLGVEEQFYLLWPACVWLIPERKLPQVCAAGFLTAFALRWYFLHVFGTTGAFLLMNTFMRMDTLLAGAFCALAVRNPELLTLVRKLLPYTAGATLLGMIFIDARPHELWDRAYHTQLYGFSILAIGYASVVLGAYLFAGSGNLADRFLNLAPLRAFGKYSYGIYVYHNAVYEFMALHFGKDAWYGRWFLHSVLLSVVSVAMAFGVAFVSFHLFEKRFLSLKRYFRAETPALAAIAVPGV